MSLRSLISLATGLAAALSTPAGAVPLRICAEPDNLPMSQQSTRSGAEIEVAELLAKELKRPLEIVWVSQRDPSYFRQTIGGGACDAIMSVPAGFRRLATTRPWYRTGFYFVGRVDTVLPRSFDDPALRPMRIGVPVTGLGDTAPVAVLTRRSLQGRLRPFAIYDPAGLAGAVRDHTVDVALLWGPFAGWYAAQAIPPLAIVAAPSSDGPATPLAFDISIGVAPGNEALKSQLDQALDLERPAIAAVLAKWHVPVEAM